MKILLFLTATLLTLATSSQTNVYHAFPDTGAVWNVNAYYFCHASIQYENDYYSYLFTGDTTIGTYNYHKLTVPFLYHAGLGTLCPPIAVGYKGCIRQDTSLRKVFIVPPDNSMEQVLYDFSLQVGDTVRFWTNGLSHPPYIVSVIDSVLIGNDYRKRWHCPHGCCYDFSFIEGMGSLNGLLEPAWSSVASDGISFSLNCYKQNGTILYNDILLVTICDIIDAVNNLPKKNTSLNIFPNPVNSSASVQVNSDFENSALKIYNSLGLLVREERIINLKTFVMNRNELHNGIYFLQLINDRGQITVEQFVFN